MYSVKESEHEESTSRQAPDLESISMRSLMDQVEEPSKLSSALKSDQDFYDNMDVSKLMSESKNEKVPPL